MYYEYCILTFKVSFIGLLFLLTHFFLEGEGKGEEQEHCRTEVDKLRFILDFLMTTSDFFPRATRVD